MDLFLLVEKYSGSPTPVIITETQVPIYQPRPSFAPLYEHLPKELKPVELVKPSIKATSIKLGKRDIYIAPAVPPEDIKSPARFKSPKFSIEARPVYDHPVIIESREAIRPSLKLPVSNLYKIVPPELPPPPVVVKPVKVKPPVVKEVIPVPELVRPNFKIPELNLQKNNFADRKEEVEESVEIPELARPNFKIPEIKLQRNSSADREEVEESIEVPGVVRPNIMDSFLKVSKPNHREVSPEGTTHIPELPELNLKAPEIKLHKKIYIPEETKPLVKPLPPKPLVKPLPAPEPVPEPVLPQDDIDSLIDLSPPPNETGVNQTAMLSQKLECIALLTTSFEIENGRVETFFKRLQLSETYDLDFVIFLNKKASVPGLDIIAPHFNNVYVVSTEIAAKDDVRVDDGKGLEYGACSGPNILFLKSMKFCERYSTTLVLETDCYLQPSWLNRCINYVEYSGSFIIAGSHYHGKIQLDSNDPSLFKHINGVAFYNTSSQYFKTLMDTTDLFIRSQALCGISHAYDVAIYECILKFIRGSKNVPYWTYIHHNVNTTTLIVNISLPIDASTPLSEVLDKFPKAVIIHKKDDKSLLRDT